MSERGGPRWRLTEAARRAVVLGMIMVAGGVYAHRLEPVLLAAPLLLTGVLALGVRVRGVPTVRLDGDTAVPEAGRTEQLVVELDPPAGAETLAVRLPMAERDGIGEVHLLPATLRRITVTLPRRSWGELIDARCDVLAAGPDGLRAYGPEVGRELRRTVLPPLHRLPAGSVPPRASGLVGSHRAPRPGDGTELRDIRPFRAGDRLRRIDWRVSLRASAGGSPGALHVRERHAESDGHVLFLLDARADLGADVAQWSRAEDGARFRENGSIDAAARAITALAAAFLEQGDRVGLLDVSRPRQAVPPAGGRRQLRRIRLRFVLSVRATATSARPVLGAAAIPPGALVVLVSTFTDDAIVESAVHAIRRGARVLALDVLPGPLTVSAGTEWAYPAFRLLYSQRVRRVAALRRRGVPVLRWSDRSALPVVLRALSRPGARR